MGEVTSYTKEKIDEIEGASIVNAEIVGDDLVLTKGDDTTITIPLPGGLSQEDLDAAIAALVDTAPGTLDTLNELAAALGDDADFAASVTAALALKASSDDLDAAIAALDAAAIPFASTATIAATDVQAAIEEVAAEAGVTPQDGIWVGVNNGGPQSVPANVQTRLTAADLLDLVNGTSADLEWDTVNNRVNFLTDGFYQIQGNIGYSGPGAPGGECQLRWELSGVDGIFFNPDSYTETDPYDPAPGGLKFIPHPRAITAGGTMQIVSDAFIRFVSAGGWIALAAYHEFGTSPSDVNDASIAVRRIA